MASNVESLKASLPRSMRESVAWVVPIRSGGLLKRQATVLPPLAEILSRLIALRHVPKMHKVRQAVHAPRAYSAY